jgi:hypothetical protein
MATPTVAATTAATAVVTALTVSGRHPLSLAADMDSVALAAAEVRLPVAPVLAAF